MSEVLKFMHNYWYARSKDLLVDIPSEHYHGILGGSMNPSSEVHDYIKAAIDWVPQWGFNLFHVLHVEQNSIQSMKKYMQAALDPKSRGWFGIQVYAQDSSDFGCWMAVSQPNLDLASWILAWFIVDLSEDVMEGHSWTITHATLQRVHQVFAYQAIIKCFFQAVQWDLFTAVLPHERVCAWEGLSNLLRL
ncbi:hypothetical protein SCLCIDRAFT_22262 [Scleroderma citrinum Foug A]|uniref:Uncharacterized protein n=1 Tax=Scleroderma citrinum Foug A TaxID=1036808 RepID=A0A0C3DZT3_9AGAM|nr:hypothetical protein SCLCIDRAFT_22262 [Scleroderma citrinum Foug A]